MFIKDYLSLSPEDKIIVTKRQIEDEKTPKQWIESLRKVVKVDEQGDAVRVVSYRVGIAGIVCFVIAFIGFVFLEITPLFPLFIVAVILVVGGFAGYFISKQFDLPGDLMKETIIPILYLLQEDLKKDGKVRLKLDLRGFKHNDKAEGSQDDHRHSRHKITNYFYRDNWFEGRAVLADGTELIWKVNDFVRHRVKKKYGSSGKSKGKEIKNKSRSFISVQAGVNKNNFALPSGYKQKGEEGKIFTRKQDGKHWMTVQRTIKHAEGEVFVPKYFIDTVASVYMRAKPLGGNQ